MRTNTNKKANLIISAVLMLFISLGWITAGNGQPVEDWVKRYNNFDKNDKAKVMKVDAEGNIYVTGYSESKAGDRDILTIKYSRNGDQLWAAYYDGGSNTQNRDDEANALAIDDIGNVYVAGYTNSGLIGRDYCTICYNPKGDQVWVSYFSGSGSIEDSDDEATGIAYSKAGFIYVTGNSAGSTSGLDIYTIQYNVNGDQMWVRSFNGSANADDRAVAILTDRNENIIISGVSEGIIGGKDYVTIKYDLYGRESWQAVYNGVGGNIAANDDEPVAMTLDRDNNIYVTGSGYGSGTLRDFLTIKYNTDGLQSWVSRFENAHLKKIVTSDDEAKAIAADAFGNIFVTGKTTSSLGGSDYLTIKINEKGFTEWSRTFNSESFDKTLDGANDLAVDRIGNVYVTGSINGDGALTDCGNERGIDFGTIKYSSTGQQLWMKQYNGTGGIGSNDDIAKAIALDRKGRIFVMGESMGDETGLDYCLVGYSEFLPNEESKINAVNSDPMLGDNYPNPFNPTTQISFNIPVSSNVKLGIYDMSGRMIELLVNKILQPGSHEYEWNASHYSSGTYFYKIESDGFVQTKKMLLIK
ncbi:MAG: SBBP repeat-containing protein [Ignavibacteria bacterium]